MGAPVTVSVHVLARSVSTLNGSDGAVKAPPPPVASARVSS